MIDLHTHTTASDGTLSPAELVRLAAERRLAGVAITDHDTLEGVPAALAEGARCGVTVVPGVEISVAWSGPELEPGRPGWLHLLVYHLPLDGDFARRLTELQSWRAERNQRIVDRLAGLGCPITLDEVRAASGGGQVGRPHFARVLVDRGVVDGPREAFDRYLGKGAPAYVDRRRLTMEDALRRARAEGAVPVLAHPCSLGLDDEVLRARLAAWRRAGLGGLEVWHPRHGAEYRTRLGGLARMLDLVATGGSDFHGAHHPEVALGTGVDRNLSVPDRVLEQLRARHQECAA